MPWNDFQGSGGGGVWLVGDPYGHNQIDLIRQNFAMLSSLQYQGTAAPEGAVTAPIGSMYRRTTGGHGTTWYLKASGAGNTGWVPVIPATVPVAKGNLGATPTFDLSAGNVQLGTLSANVTGITLSNPVDGQGYMLVLQQDATGSRTVTGWPATVKWPSGTAPTVTPTANKRDVITLRWLATPGIYLAAFAQNYD